MGKDAKRDQVEFDGSWIAIIICFAAFWPLGLFLLWRKLKKTTKRSKDVRQYTGIGSAAGVIGLIMMGLGNVGWGILTALFGAGILGAAKWSDLRERRYQKYIAIIGNRPYMSIRSLAASIPVPVDQAKRDLQDMIHKGYFDAMVYIDMHTMDLVLDGDAYASHVSDEESKARAQRPRPAAAQPERARPEAKRPEAAQAKTSDAGAQTKAPNQESPYKDAQFAEYIRQIKAVNDRIDDAVISEKIDRIEAITSKIFSLVEKRPEMMPQIRTFMNYYLPTTLKLLDSYAILEKQGVHGENISASEQQIEAIMDTLIAAYEKQLDQLFKSQVMDISTDIEVLESMMAKDGLTESKYVLRQQGG